MRVLYNGQEREVAGPSVAALLVQLEVTATSVAVAVNRAFVPRSEFAATLLREGDEIEVLEPMVGG